MKLKTSRKALTVAVAAVLGTGMAMSSLADADENPFGAIELDSGYMQLADSHGEEGSCGEGKCGDDAEGGEEEGGDDAEGEGDDAEGEGDDAETEEAEEEA